MATRIAKILQFKINDFSKVIYVSIKFFIKFLNHDTVFRLNFPLFIFLSDLNWARIRLEPNFLPN